jgi:hypothetical protein|nr:MAG TPA: hypothetical protein [Caudoviricetes sp.]
MKIFQLDIEKLTLLLIPTFLRKPNLVGWLRILVAPIVRLHYDFTLKRAADLNILSLNGQVCRLRKALNDAFDPIHRRIRILDGNQYRNQYIYTEAERKPKYLGTLYLHRSVDYADTGVDFIVKVPQEVWNVQKTPTSQIGHYRFFEMEALIDFYKLASKRYIIAL